MNNIHTATLKALAMASVCGGRSAETEPAQSAKYGLVIHGGAGVILPQQMPPEIEAAYRAKLQEALDAGYTVLDRGGAAMDAVVAVVTILEDSPLFNAGHGAVLNADGNCELDSAVMDGRTLMAGAVAGLMHIKNPITLARTVMEKSKHVMLVGEGAEKFAQQQSFEFVPNSYFKTERRIKELERVKEQERQEFNGIKPTKAREAILAPADHPGTERKYGTVGCVALDKKNNLAAGTSTGGLTNKRFGRIGDSPIIGAGTYANNRTCALSATGTGEYFIRTVVGHDVSAQMEYLGSTLKHAAATTLAKVGTLGGDGGLIAIDKNGNVAMPFNTPGMYRGFRLSDGRGSVKLYGATNSDPNAPPKEREQAP